MFRRLLALVLSLSFVTFAASAQDSETSLPEIQVTPSAVVRTAEDTLDFRAWTQLADRTETALKSGRASDSFFAQLREKLVDWRAAFAVGKDVSNININTLEGQISTLGPPPAEGKTEPAILTQRRDELTKLLNAARQPVQAAQEAHSRANILISEIDALTRTRQTNALISLGTSPLNPSNWPRASQDIGRSIGLALRGVSAAWGTSAQTAELKRGLPQTIALVVLGLVLLVRGRRWVVQIAERMFERASGRGRGAIGFLMSLGQVVAPVAGIYALIVAVNRIGVLDVRAQVYIDILPLLGFAIFGAMWLGGRVFGAPTTLYPVVELSNPMQVRQGRLIFALLGLVIALSGLLQDISEFEGFSGETNTVLIFPIVFGAGLLLVGLGMILKSAQFGGESEVMGLRHRSIPFLARVLFVLGIAAPIAAVIGYSAIATRMIYPVILTLFLLGLLQVLSFFISDLFAFVTRRRSETVREGLAPVLASFALTIAALPVFALIWGAQMNDLTELWTRLGQGFALGESRITPRTLLTFGFVFGMGFIVTRVVQNALKTTILPKTRMDIGGRNAITSGIGYTGIFLAGIAAFTSAGVDLSSLAIVAGALSLGIGFGLQNVVSNFVSGIILLIERPVSEGDWIEVGGQMGYVRDISVRSTRIETFDRTDVIVPNSDLISGVVTNYTRGNSIGRVIVSVGVAYGTDTRRVEAILREIAEAHPLVSINPAPSVVFQGFGADALDFEIRAILKDVNFILSVKSDINHEIAQRFVAEGIEIPFAQRDIWLRNPEVLTGEALVGGVLPNDGAAQSEPVKAAGTSTAAQARAGLEADDMPGGEGDE